jgi:outer membrane protein assembly factor BamB
MIAKYQAGITIGFALATFFVSQVSWGRPTPTVSRSFADETIELGSRQDAVSDNFGRQLNSEGAMHGVTLRRTRVYGAQGLQEPKIVLWKTPKLFIKNPEQTLLDLQIGLWPLPGVGGGVYRSGLNVITADKEAYFTVSSDSDEYVCVIDLQTGEPKMKLQLRNVYISKPVVAGDLLFLGRSDGGFFAFDRRVWKEKWRIIKKGYRFDGASSAVTDGTIYFGGAEYAHPATKPKPKGGVHAVDALTGAEKWVFTIKGISTPIAVADEVVYFGDYDRHLFAVNAKTGKEVWKFTASYNIKTPALMGGRVFFSDAEGNLYAMDLKDGQAIWKAAKKNKVATPLIAYNNMIYYGGTKNNLYALDALTGQEKWVYQTTKPFWAPVMANGAIYVTSFDNTLLAIDAESGQERWKYTIPHIPYSHPVVGNGVIYYVDREGVMYALGSS